MPVPTLISELSTTIASNSPAGSESPASLDDYQRAHAAFIAQLHANTVAAPTVIVASATSTAIGAAASENVDISGTTTITGFGTIAEGINRKGRFTGILTLTHNATSLILPGAANITTAPDDRYEARSLGAGNWIVTKYERANGGAINTTFKVGPEAMPEWPSTWRMVDVGAESAMGEDSTGQTVMVNNAYTTNGTDWLYRATGAASRTRYLADGSSEFAIAPSAGGAGTAATFTIRRDVVSFLDYMTANQILAVKNNDYSVVTPASIRVAMQTALDSSSGLLLPKGVYKIDSTLAMNDDNFIIGMGRGSKILSSYDGPAFAGKNVTTAATTNVRRYHGGGRDFWLEGPGRTLNSSVGLQMQGCSMFKWNNTFIYGFDTAVAQGNGYSTYYNEYSGVDISACDIGYYNTALGNENMVVGGRIVDCLTGTSDSDNSHNKYIGLAVETFTTAAHSISGPASQQIQYLCSRIENPASAGIGFSINSTARDTQIMYPQIINAATPISDSGVRTNIIASENWKISGGTGIKTHQRVTAAVDIASVPASSTLDTIVSVAGALATDSVFITPPAALPAGLVCSAIPTSGGVYIRLANVYGATAVDPALLTYTIDIWRHV